MVTGGRGGRLWMAEYLEDLAERRDLYVTTNPKPKKEVRN